MSATKKRPAKKAKGKKLFGSKTRPRKRSKPETNGVHAETTLPAAETPSPETTARVETPTGAPIDEDQHDREVAETTANASKATAAATAAVAHLTMEQDDVDRLFDLRQKAFDAQQVLIARTEERKAAKKRSDAANDDVFTFLDEIRNPRPLIKFGENQQKNGSANGHVAVVNKATGEVTPADEAWRQDPIDVLSDEGVVGVAALSEAVLAKLRKAGVITIGDMVDYTDATKHGGYQRNITDIDGIGKVAAESISDATIAYWAWQSHRAPAPEAAAAATAHADESWKVLPVLDNLRGLPAKVIEKLNAAGINTLGELEAAGDLKKLKGIGKAVAAKIATALAGFWERRTAQPEPTSDPHAATKCPHCGAELAADDKIIECPLCSRDGCGSCMPAGVDCACPQCEAGDGEGDDREPHEVNE